VRAGLRNARAKAKGKRLGRPSSKETTKNSVLCWNRGCRRWLWARSSESQVPQSANVPVSSLTKSGTVCKQGRITTEGENYLDSRLMSDNVYHQVGLSQRRRLKLCA
jgi:hypothetical protein